MFDGKVIGDLSKYGIKSPLADNGLDVAMGMEQRAQTISNQPNAAYLDSHVPSYDYLDIDTSVDLGSHVSLRLGVNNVFDRQPPIIGFNANPLLVNGNMLASIYDTFGRYLFVGLTAKY